MLLNSHVDEEVVTYVANTSLAMRISRYTLHAYISLLNHLVGINNTRGWDVCSSQIRHHADKLELIRGKYRHRIQVIYKLYMYLIDGMTKNWMSLKIQNAEITSLRAQVSQQGAAERKEGIPAPTARAVFTVGDKCHVHGRTRGQLRQKGSHCLHAAYVGRGCSGSTLIPRGRWSRSCD